MKQRTRFITRTALFAALMCVLCPLAFPVGPVPFTFGVFAVLFTATVLPWKQAACAVLMYILIGAIGMPVFSGGQAGFGVLLGPTGGYLWSYVPMAILAGQGRSRLPRSFIFCAAALLLCYICGTWQFAVLSGRTWKEALSACVLPFLPFDVLKLACACLSGRKLCVQLERAELL